VKKNDFVKKGEILLELDNSEMLYEIKKCETRYKIAQLKYEKYKSGLTGDVPGSATELEKLKLDTEAEKNELDYYVNKNKAMSLIAPIDGCITSSLDIKRGDLIRADEVVFTVSDINDLLVEYNGDGASYLKKGMKVSLEYGGKVYEGEVADGGDKISQNVGMARLRILNMKDRVSIGESIDINVQVFRKDNTIVIPRNAIYYNDKKSYVVVLENGTRVERMVQTGFEFDYDIEIIKGLNEGDKVITE
jgi:RND family efflux transporter MFP subunit